MEINTEEDPQKPHREGVCYTLGTTDSLYTMHGWPRVLAETQGGAYATKVSEREQGLQVFKIEMGKTKRGATRYVWTLWIRQSWQPSLHVLTAFTAKTAHEAAMDIIKQLGAAQEQRAKDAFAAFQRGDTTGFSDIEVIGAVLQFGEHTDENDDSAQGE